MIFLDPGKFFDEAVHSVLDQTYPAVELVLVDDGSTDGSSAAARAFAEEYPGRVRVVEHPGHVNRGMSAARNLGVREARGELVAFLDADDVWEPGHLAGDVALLQAHPEAGMVCGRTLHWWDGTGDEDFLSPLPFAPGSVLPPPLLLRSVLRWGAVSTPICNLLVRADALREVGGSEESFRGAYEDQVLLSKLELHVTAVVSGQVSSRYRQHAGSHTTAANPRAAQIEATGREQFLRWLSGYVAASPHRDDAQLREALDAALAPAAAGPTVVSRVRGAGRAAVRRLPPSVPLQLRRLARPRRPGLVRLGSLASTEPISRSFGYGRGLPVDRHYIEGFLAENAENVRGRVLEVGDPSYTRRFGGSRVSRADVLNVDASMPGTTFAADLADAPELPSDTFDCIVLTQTLHLVYDMAAAVRTLHRILRPGGTVLATVPGISPVSEDRWAETWYWSLTPRSARLLFEEAFAPDLVEVRHWGNVLSAVAFVEGLAAQELRPHELATVDPQYPVTVAVRAFKPA
nr:glycosyltransferase [Motilibacter aurantiacus]